ncbi:MAG: hypothetical protein EB084_26265 [Proteobacteria bacterium]|nr:hypothetical protein [Pseudomonadota bacterium]
MLDTYIIEELKRRERERAQKERQRPSIEIPVAPRRDEEEDRRSEREETPNSGVVHIQLF